MFIALSGVAVPACQHYDAGGSPEREQAGLRLPPPSTSERPPRVELKLDAYS
ncbi:hypothetical protein [Luteitalea sp.]|uniref:hypothetical protein n=1 Tax=Luteitalea sp. TaxID=2004800 RepID=UPI0025C3BCE7|nr:hypothetical protein [Luteitalea sp.]